MMYIPDATYRVQMNADFNFNQLKEILPYLQELGISTVYASPITQAAAGSTHGYDVTDPQQISTDIGTEEEFEKIGSQLREYGMGWLQDIVPNHMALTPENYRLMDVLERGPVSNYYHHFDINWTHPVSMGKLMLFILPEDKPDMQQLRLVVEETGFHLMYDQLKLPLSLPAWNKLLGYLRLLADKDPVMKTLVILNTRVVRIPQMEVWKKYKRSIFRYLLNDEECSRKLMEWTGKLLADKKIMKELLDAQYYVLRNYRDANSMINYRRFFTINSLICLSMERNTVFSSYHRMLKCLQEQGLIQGLRIDHLDGLADPAGYLNKLRKLFGEDCYIVAEKIMGKNEPLPASWPLQGSTGYDFISLINQLFTPPEGSRQLLDWYHHHINRNDFRKETVLNKMKVLEALMKGEWDNLYKQFVEAGFFTVKGKWMNALGALICCLPVYRIYPHAFPLKDEELVVLKEATDTAVQYFPSLEKELHFLLSIFKGEREEEKALPLLTRLMQYTGALMAKGVEDTSFYTWNAFIARNEVGDAPDRLSTDPIQDFHAAMQQRLQASPHTLNATATHDTKRGEDARVRLLTLAEDPEDWLKLVDFFFNLNAPLVKIVNRKPAPARNDEYFIYQTIVGALPPGDVISKEWMERLRQYMQKALREGKMNSSWNAPAENYEQACMDFIAGLFKSKTFLTRIKSFVKELDERAGIYSLSQLLLKLTAPGIPDIYQGCELWDYSFVDPDNRRPVDYGIRKKLLDNVQEYTQNDVDQWWEQLKKKGAGKLFVCAKTLALRKKYPLLFREGEYIPLEEQENKYRISFARRWGNTWAIISCPVPGGRATGEEMFTIPEEAPVNWIDVFTGKQVKARGRQLAATNGNGYLPVILLLALK
jgi:(1->4)-alpha-D-glucan 1-alpha-D-glucosylmutase